MREVSPRRGLSLLESTGRAVFGTSGIIPQLHHLFIFMNTITLN